VTDWLDAIAAQPLAAVCLTVVAYALAEALWRRSGRAAPLNPVLVATTLVAGILLALGVSYEAYIDRARPIDDALPAIIVLLAVPLCRQMTLVRASGAPLAAALVFGSTVALATALIFPAVAGAGDELVATLAPKSATAAVAVEVSKGLGGVAGLTAVIVISTGVFGAAFGPALLDLGGVVDERARGFALGVASHAIGTARALQMSETAGAFASIGMILNGLLTIVLAPIAYALMTRF